MKTCSKWSLAFVVIGAVGAQLALAQGVGNLSSLPSSFVTNLPVTGWVVGDPAGGPVPVVLDPAGPKWLKRFAGPQGTPFQYPYGSAPLTLVEFLEVSGELPWTDWHENLLVPDWTWANPILLVNGQPAPGLTTQIVGGNLSFFFDPVAPGSIITIEKQLVWNGQPGSVYNGYLLVEEFPTIPEPAALALLGLGGMFLRRR